MKSNIPLVFCILLCLSALISTHADEPSLIGSGLDDSFLVARDYILIFVGKFATLCAIGDVGEGNRHHPVGEIHVDSILRGELSGNIKASCNQNLLDMNGSKEKDPTSGFTYIFFVYHKKIDPNKYEYEIEKALPATKVNIDRIKRMISTPAGLLGSSLPLESEISSASDVVIAKFVNLGTDGYVSFTGLHYSGAKISVQKTLKGIDSGLIDVGYSVGEDFRVKEIGPNLKDTYILILEYRGLVRKALPYTSDNLAKVERLIATTPMSK